MSKNTIERRASRSIADKRRESKINLVNEKETINEDSMESCESVPSLPTENFPPGCIISIEKSRELLASYKKPNVKPLIASLLSLENTVGNHNVDDYAIQELTLALNLGVENGFTLHQIARWLTIYIHVLESKGKEPETRIAAFQTPPRVDLVFLPHQLQTMLNFVKIGFDQHSKLINHYLNHIQQVVDTKLRVRFEPPKISLMPLAVSIPKDKWREYCKQEDEKSALEKMAIAEKKQQAELKSEMEEKMMQSEEIISRIMAKQGLDAEMELWKPIPSYPHPYLIPNYENIFHKRDLVHPPVKQGTKNAPAVAKDKQAHPPGTQRELKPLGVPQAIQKSALKLDEIEDEKHTKKVGFDGKLPCPLRNTEPFVWQKAKKVVPKLEEKKVEIVKKEYIPLDPNQELSRLDLSDLISAHMDQFLSEWQQQFQARLEWDTQQWQNRIDAIHKCQIEKEAEIQRCKHEQELIAQKIAELAKPRPVEVVKQNKKNK